MWLDVGSIRLLNGEWHLATHTPSHDEEICLAGLDLHEGRPFRFVPRLRIGTAPECCRVELTVKGGGAGCRIIGDFMQQVATRYTSVDDLPSSIYLSATAGFHVRGLLTLSYLGNPQLRNALFQGYSWQAIPSRKGETAEDYESRAVSILGKHLSDYVKLDAGSLYIKKVRSKPDGLFLNESTNTLAVVEAKKRVVDFAEGTSQLIQYYTTPRREITRRLETSL